MGTLSDHKPSNFSSKSALLGPGPMRKDQEQGKGGEIRGRASLSCDEGEATNGAEPGPPCTHLQAVAAHVVAEDLVRHHAALCPHRQAPLAAGAWLWPQQEGSKHISPQQGQGTGPRGWKAGEAVGRIPSLGQPWPVPLSNGQALGLEWHWG